MAKRKHNSDDESEEYNSEVSDNSSKPKAKAKKQTAVKVKAKTESGSSKKKRKDVEVEDDGSGEEVTQESSGGITIRSNSDGNKYVDLGKKRRGTVRAFKGTAYLDIREYYVQDGEERPGKKGISLTREQWETLKKCQNDIDNLLVAAAKSK